MVEGGPYFTELKYSHDKFEETTFYLGDAVLSVNPTDGTITPIKEDGSGCSSKEKYSWNGSKLDTTRHLYAREENPKVPAGNISLLLIGVFPRARRGVE